MPCLSAMFLFIFLLAGINAAGVGEAWQVTPYVKSVYTNHPFRPRLDSSAFEVRTVSGVGRLAPLDESQNLQKRPELTTPGSVEPNALSEGNEEALSENKNLENIRKLLEEDSPYGDGEGEDVVGAGAVPIQRIFQKTLMMRLLHVDKDDDDDDDDVDDEQATRGIVQRIRRQAENETSMEKISTTKNVREARLNSPEAWSTAAQPISVEFRHRIPLDQVIQQQQEEEEAAALSSIYRRHQAPRADFVTGQQHRRYPDYRESRDMPVTKNYDDYDPMSWYRNAIRDRDYEYPSYRRGYSYQYPTERYRMERDYYMRSPNDQYHYDRYDRYRDDNLDLYGRNRAAPKPKRIIYYATLPEVVRKPVDLRNYPRYDAGRTSATRDSTYKRIPGNVDPSKYRYRQSYGSYDPYTKRSSYYDHPYGYPEDDSRRVRVSTKENLNDRFGSATNERKVSNLIAIRDEDSGKLPWPVQIGTEVSIKDDERIPGRKIFGESSIGYGFQSAQLQKAPDATGSSELQSDN